MLVMIVALFAGAGLVASCSFRQELTVAPDGSGSADIRVTLSPMLTSYMEDLIASFGGAGNGGSAAGGGSGAQNSGATGAAGSSASGALPIFNVEQVKQAFLATGGVESVTATTPNPSTLLINLTFTNLARVFAAGSSLHVEQPLTFTNAGGVATLRLHLSRDNFSALSSLPPFKENPALLSLAPQGAQHYSAQQYLDVLDYAFGDYANGASVADIVNGSKIEVAVTVRGEILSQKGGVARGNTVLFTVPLLRVLTLEQPIDYVLSFR